MLEIESIRLAYNKLKLNGIDVDTRDYDELLGRLWAKMEELEDYSGDWADKASFEIFMARYLC